MCSADVNNRDERVCVNFKSLLFYHSAWTNMKISREIEDRQRYDEISFKRAGKGPIPKTYKYDPTKAAKDVAAMQANRK